MAKARAKTATRAKSSRAPRRAARKQRRPRWTRLPRPVVAAVGLLIVVLAFAFLGGSIRSAVWQRLGLAIAPIAGAAFTIAWLLWRRCLARSLVRWNRWLGLAALAAGLIGLLSFFSIASTPAGGSLGTAIIGDRDALGALRVLGLALLSALLLAPRRSSKVLAETGRESIRIYRRRPWEPALAKLAEMARIAREQWQRARANRQATPAVDDAALQEEWTQEEPFPIQPQGSLPEAAPVQKSLPFGEDGEDGEGDEQAPTAQAGSGRWQLPPIDLLEQGSDKDLAPADNRERARLIEEALASYGVEARVVQINPGPAVTQFGVDPGWDHRYREVKERDEFGRVKLDREGRPRVRQEEVSRTRVKVERITALSNNLALALAAPSVRIEAPVPGKSVVGIEVPNLTMGVVTLRGVIESLSFQRAAARSKLALALGNGVAGEAVAADLARMPHLLIAGATGSGKSVCINSIVACLLMHSTPEDVRLLMVDPKRVELAAFNSVPHLLAPVVVDMDKVVGTLRWVAGEMDRRYRALAAAGARNIDAFNRSPRATEKMPYWVVIIDELADLMMAAPYEVERTLCRLAQLARAVGIHLIVATQRPSVDVVTGLIKANFPTRIAFAVTSQVDSRTILDGGGAEKLLGRGDMLYMPTDAAKPKRLQGTFVSDQEIERIVSYWTSARFLGIQPRQFFEEIEQAASTHAEGKDEDELMEKARGLAREHTRISTSLLQRRLRIGYNRAARIIEELEEEGIVGPAEDGRSREVLAHREDDEDEDLAREKRDHL